MVSRWQQCWHTVINECGEFALDLLPSGIFRKDVVNVLGNGVVIDLVHLCGEIESLQAVSIDISPQNLKIRDRASIVFHFHKALDQLEEQRLGVASYDSTKCGIASIYNDKYQKKTIQVGMLLPGCAGTKNRVLLKWKNLIIEGLLRAKPFVLPTIMVWLKTYGDILRPYIADTGRYLDDANRQGKQILFEALLEVLRDIELGIYRYSSSSSQLAAYAALGSSAPSIQVNHTVSIVKAYSSYIGNGLFIAEWDGDKAERLREAGGEYGVETGQPIRVGTVDLVATRYGIPLQACNENALTKLDVLD